MKMWYVLVCLECTPHLPMPFESPEARGKWAAAHTRGTEHDSWFVLDQLDLAEVQHPDPVAERQPKLSDGVERPVGLGGVEAVAPFVSDEDGPSGSGVHVSTYRHPTQELEPQ